MQLRLAKRFCIRLIPFLFLAKDFEVLIFGSLYQDKEQKKETKKTLIIEKEIEKSPDTYILLASRRRRRSSAMA